MPHVPLRKCTHDAPSTQLKPCQQAAFATCLSAFFVPVFPALAAGETRRPTLLQSVLFPSSGRESRQGPSVEPVSVRHAERACAHVRNKTLTQTCHDGTRRIAPQHPNKRPQCTEKKTKVHEEPIKKLGLCVLYRFVIFIVLYLFFFVSRFLLTSFFWEDHYFVHLVYFNFPAILFRMSHILILAFCTCFLICSSFVVLLSSVFIIHSSPFLPHLMFQVFGPYFCVLCFFFRLSSALCLGLGLYVLFLTSRVPDCWYADQHLQTD